MESHCFFYPLVKTMQKGILLLVFSIIFCSFGMTQKDSVLVLFEISDKAFREPIQNVNGTFVNSGDSFYEKSGTKGIIQVFALNNSTLSYHFNHPLYISVSGTEKIQMKNSGDTLIVKIEMAPTKAKVLKPVVVKAVGVPVTVFESSRLSVADFEIQKDGKLVLLTYPKQLKKGSELLLYDGIEVLNSFSVPGIAEELVCDYRGNAHVLCSENVFGIYVQDQQIGISTLEKDYYSKYIQPIVDTNKSKMFFSNFNKDYPAFNYFTYDQIDSTYSKIIEIEDELMMELYRSEYKWVDVRTKLWAKNKEIQTGIDAEIWVGANYFTQSPYYKQLYAPLFSRNDTVFVFDYYKDQLFSFNNAGESLDSIPIYHHYQPKSTGWQKQLIQDKETGEIYAVFEISGYTYLGLINTKTGEISEKVRLEYRYVDKIAIRDNFVYYIYRPFESNQKKYLYKEHLPYEFGKMNSPGSDQIMTEGN